MTRRIRSCGKRRRCSWCACSHCSTSSRSGAPGNSILSRRHAGHSKPLGRFYDDETFERLVAAASNIDAICLLVVLLGGEASLRAGEILALRLRHCDLRRGVLRIEENEWHGHIGTPKGQRTRHVVMTPRLRATLLDLATNPPPPTAASSAAGTAPPRPSASSTAGYTGPSAPPASPSRAPTSCDTPSAPASPPPEPPPGPSRSSPVTATPPPPTATCT